MNTMSKKPKPTRILTIPHVDKNAKEFIEVDLHGTIWWKSEEDISGSTVSAGFPVTVEFVADKFVEQGRDFDVAKLPSHTIHNPYAHWL